MEDLLIDLYGTQFERELLKEIADVGIYKSVPAGEVLMDFGQYVKSMPLLLNGAIKIFREDQDGDELLLYFLEKAKPAL